MHVESYLYKEKEQLQQEPINHEQQSRESYISPEEVDLIINRASNANQGKKSTWKRIQRPVRRHNEPVKKYYADRYEEIKEDYLLVDGYNIIHAWSDLKELADNNMDGARIKLLDSLSNFQGIIKCHVIVVFDAYRVQGHPEEVCDYNNIHVVYTREAQTADQYIEKFAHDNKKKYNITVATSDGLQQIIIRGAGCALLSARELKADIERVENEIKMKNRDMQEKSRNYISDSLSPEAKRQMNDLVREDK